MFTISVKKGIFIGFGILLTVLIYVILQQKKKYFMKPENIFVLLSVILGPLYLLSVPIFQVPDEVNHYVRAYGIVHGYFLSPEGGKMPIPDNLIPYEWYTYTPYILLKNFKMEINPDNCMIHDNVNMALYAPFSYIFQVLGIGAADLLCNNTYILVFAGSLVNMAGCTLLLYYAIKILPYGKWIIAFISLLPIALQERASLSVDTITYAAVVTMMAFCLYMRQKHTRMNLKEAATLYLLIALVSSCKVVYFPTAFLLMLIPKECFANRRKEILLKAAGIMETFVFSAGWLLIAKNYLGNTLAGGDSAEKIQYILRNPGRYLYILDKMFWENEEGLIGEMFGSKLGSLNIVINVTLIMFVALLFCKAYYGEKDRREKPDYPAEVVMLLMSAGMILLIATSLYIQWTVLAASTYYIQGLQGRYFLPVLAMVCCGLVSVKKKERGRAEENQSNVFGAVWGLYVVNLLVIMEIIVYSSYTGA